MLVRQFTEGGNREYKSLIDDIFQSVERNNKDISKGYTSELKSRINQLKKNNSLSVEFEKKIQFEVKKFSNRHEFGVYLDKIFSEVSGYELVNNNKLWDWITLQYFDQIFTDEGSHHIWRFVLIDDHKLKYRNLSYTPWWLARHYGKEDSRIFLTRHEMDVGGDWIEQFTKKNHVRNYRKIAHICHILYFDEEEDRDIPGTSKGNEGALQDFCDEIKYLNLLYDLYAMAESEILKKLPKRFFQYMKKIGKEVEIDGHVFE